MPQPIEVKLVPVVLVYHCRRCQKPFHETVEADDCGDPVTTLAAVLLNATNGLSSSPRARIHECETYVGLGIADLVGGNLKAADAHS